MSANHQAGRAGEPVTDPVTEAVTEHETEPVTGPGTEPGTGPVAVRYVDDVETLRVLSDPLRLAIVNLLMDGAHREPKVRTAKELAHELGQPQTKLYRHIKQLQAVGVIQVAATRLVSGIVEHRYRTGQLSLRIDSGFLGGEAPVDDTLRTLAAVLDGHRDDLFTAIREGRVRLDGDDSAEPVRHAVAAVRASVPLDRAQEFGTRLKDLVDEFVGLDHDPEGIKVNLLVAYYAAG